MRPFILILILIAAFQLFSLSAFGQNAEYEVVTDTTLVPGAPYYTPWQHLPTHVFSPMFATLFLCCDSATGYDDATALRIEAVFGSTDDDTTHKFIVPDTAAVVANLKFYADPADTCYLLPVPFFLASYHRYKFTTSDTITILRLSEMTAR